MQELEGRCIQEEAPWCVAACPIHVDARAFLGRAARGEWNDAVQVLAVTMPLHRIVARICDHPCEARCKRAEAGDALAIGDLEKAAVRLGRAMKGPTVLPPKGKRVAIAGGGLAGLSAAWDLAHKGYDVTLLSAAQRLGASLRAFPAQVLPAEVIEEEMGSLERLGIAVGLSQPTDQPGWMEGVLARFDAVYAADDESVRLRLPDFSRVDPASLSTTTEGLFAARRRPENAPFSPIGSIAEGRRAATSIDRYLQRVSLLAGREREGPYGSRLFTSLEGVDVKRLVPMADKASGYGEAEAREEASRCLACACMECVKACLFLERFQSFPKRYLRQIGNDQTMVLGSHGPTMKLVNSCSLCGLCAEVCPNGLSMAEVCMDGRASLVRRGKMGPSAHDLALADMSSASGSRAAIVSHEPGESVSAYAFFPGCQMAAIYPEHVIASYEYLRGRLEGGVGLMLRCCGVPADWAAREDLLDGVMNDLKEGWAGLGKPIMIVACPTCHRTLEKHAPEIEAITLWEVLARLAGGGLEPPSSGGGRLAVHDPCTTRSRPEVQESIRVLLRSLGYSIEELSRSRDRTECCGFGGLMSAANPALAKDVAGRRASQSKADYVTYCAMCRNALAATGKRAAHILDLFFGPSSADPWAREAVGYSERNENRFRLKRMMLESVWGKKEEGVEEYEKIDLYIDDEVAATMEERRILREDVRKVIDNAEKTGKRFRDRRSRRCRASFRPAFVTYWVEYSAEGSGFRVHNAYCHRMEIVEEGAS